MRGRVLVTRPEPGASRTARLLAEAGFEPVVLPLTEIRPLPIEPVAAAVDAIAVTSANALRHAPPMLIASLAGKPLFAVGSRTARIAKETGFSLVVGGSGDAQGLARRMLGQLSPDSRVLYLCGKVRRPDFETAMASAGLAMDVLETYDTVLVGHTDAAIISKLGNTQLQAAFVLSVKAAEALVSLTKQRSLAHLFERTNYFCISGRVAAALTGIDRGHIYVGQTPNEDALLALLERES